MILDIKSMHNIKAESNRDTIGYFEFVSHSQLAHDPVKNTQYDTLYFRVSVDIPDHKPFCLGTKVPRRSAGIDRPTD